MGMTWLCCCFLYREIHLVVRKVESIKIVIAQFKLDNVPGEGCSQGSLHLPLVIVLILRAQNENYLRLVMPTTDFCKSSGSGAFVGRSFCNEDKATKSIKHRIHTGIPSQTRSLYRPLK